MVEGLLVLSALFEAGDGVALEDVELGCADIAGQQFSFPLEQLVFHI